MDTISAVIPYVIEKTGRGERSYDIYSRLLEDRIIFIGTPIDDQVANAVMAQLLFLHKVNKSQDISIYINSPGGSVLSGMAIYDTMQYISSDVSTICVGMAASMAAVILAAGQKNKRFALPNSQVMIHQVMGGAEGQASDIEITAKQIIKMKENLNQILSKHTGQAVTKVEKDTDRDYYLDPTEAKKYGIIDEIVKTSKKVK